MDGTAEPRAEAVFDVNVPDFCVASAACCNGAARRDCEGAESELERQRRRELGGQARRVHNGPMEVACASSSHAFRRRTALFQRAAVAAYRAVTTRQSVEAIFSLIRRCPNGRTPSDAADIVA